jgi:hypothetical protein
MAATRAVSTGGWEPLGATKVLAGLPAAVLLPLPVFYLRVGWENLWGNPIFASKKHIVRICFASNQSIEINPIYLSICQSIDRSWSIYLTIDLPACNMNPKGWKSINGTPMQRVIICDKSHVLKPCIEEEDIEECRCYHWCQQFR